MSGIGKVDPARVEIYRAIERDVHGCAARQLQLRTAREHYHGEPDARARYRTDARTSRTAAGHSADAGADAGGLHHRADFLPVVRIPVNVTFTVHGLIPARSGVRGNRIEIHRVAVRQNHRVEPYADFTYTLAATGALGVGDLSLHVRSGWNQNAAVDHHWK